MVLNMTQVNLQNYAITVDKNIAISSEPKSILESKTNMAYIFVGTVNGHQIPAYLTWKKEIEQVSNGSVKSQLISLVLALTLITMVS